MLEIAALLLPAGLAALVVSAVAGAAAVVVRPAAMPATAGMSAVLVSGQAPRGSPASEPLELVARFAMYVALATLGLALVLRGLAVGHAPWSNMYEVSQAFALAVLVAFIAIRRVVAIEALTPATATLAALLVVHALSLPATADPLVPALQQPALLTVHVAAAIAAYGIYGVALVAAVAELVQRGGRAVDWLPDARTCQVAAHRAVVLGYPILTAAIVLGAVWANLAWRSYWNNDPKELTAAATWLTYGAYLHLAGRRDRWGRAAPWLIVIGFAGILLTYFGANLLFPGQHSYAGV